MTRARPTDTKARIHAVARELFMQQGVQQTSLRQIADRLGITKPALYYHFDSREALVASMFAPLISDMEAHFAALEATAPADPRALLGAHFDLLTRHRDLIVMLVRDFSILAELDLAARMFAWRHRLMTLLVGPSPSLEARVRAVVAIGGMADTTIEFPDVPMERIKNSAVEAACAALGLPPARPAAAKKTAKSARPRRAT
ncbi:TetR/AcrR family transcriptional regulator [Nannocystis punicea]|uniref:Helix-turn-helix domain containing protein n=1 Tax=Nannocystis punicea TaxID=2995304 RepID=A0ABY7GVQ7_9BACT|nr:TetR/AcrR family transcriptional regulator [Nannocystis poenicansa]WAS91061.1 helix-turn-helix domain containing protein [Nannocystis poenicansa]